MTNLVPAQESLQRLARDYWQFECEEHPLLAVLAGEHPETDALFRESAADHERRDRRAGELFAALERIDMSRLAPSDVTIHRLLEYELKVLREEQTLHAHRRLSIFPAGPEFTSQYYANTVTLTDVDAAQCYAARLATLPGYFDDVGTNLLLGYDGGIRYPAVLISQASATLRAMLQTPLEQTHWMRPFRTAPMRSERIDAQSRKVASLVEQALRPALMRYLNILEHRLGAGARSNLSCVDAPDGQIFYQSQVWRYTTLDLAPDAIHRFGMNEVARLTESLQSIAAAAGYGGRLAEFRAFIEHDRGAVAPSAHALRERAESLAKRIDKCIPAFFGRIPRTTYGIESIPESSSARMPIAYAQANPADGSAPGLFWITGLPERCPLYSLPTFVLHEAWPGHLMHLALMQEMQALPAFLRHGAFKYSACLEGWAVYCESLGVEMGVYETPQEHFGRVNSELWRAARLVVDTGIHWFDWTRERAMEYLSAHVSLSPASVAAEVDRYAGMPAQALAYHLGADAIRRLRTKAERILGDRFSLRRFHDAVIGAGPVTLPVLETALESWLAAT